MTNYDDLTPYEQQMRTMMHGDLANRAMFLSRPSVMLGLIPIPDGDQWSVLYGSNIEEGVCGFGDSPDDAMADFDKRWKDREELKRRCKAAEEEKRKSCVHRYLETTHGDGMSVYKCDKDDEDCQDDCTEAEIK